MTIFYRRPGKQTRYLDTPAGLVKVKLSPQEMADVQEVFAQWSEAFVLESKANGKELEANKFNAQEWELFQQADAKEWSSWLKNQVVNILIPEERRKCREAVSSLHQ